MMHRKWLDLWLVRRITPAPSYSVGVRLEWHSAKRLPPPFLQAALIMQSVHTWLTGRAPPFHFFSIAYWRSVSQSSWQGLFSRLVKLTL